MTRAGRPAGPSSGGAVVALLLIVALVALAIPVAITMSPSEPAPATPRASIAAVPLTPSPAPAATASPSSAALPSASGAGVDTSASSAAPARSPSPRAPAQAPSAIKPGSVNRSSIDLSATYRAAISINFGSRAINVDSTATITNTSGRPIDRVELNSIATRLGGLEFRIVTVEGRDVRATVDDQTIIVPLGGQLPAGATVPVRVAYRARLQSGTSGTRWLFAKSNNVVNIYRWLPWISHPTPFDRPHHGDPFVTPTSPHVRVRINSDRPMIYATSGDRVAVDGLTQHFEARNVRDFNITGSPSYLTTSADVGDTTIQVYYLPGGPGAAMLRAARSALARMEDLLGEYPYETYKVATSAGGYGMESPGLTWIPPGTPSGNLSFLVHHETAHQWFFSLVGNDQAREPFTDEAMTDFVARYALGLRRGSRCSTQRLDLSIYRYSAACYFEVIYIQGGNLVDDTRRVMGNSLFWRTLRRYVADHSHELVKTETLLETLDDATPLDLGDRFAPRFPRLY